MNDGEWKKKSLRKNLLGSAVEEFKNFTTGGKEEQRRKQDGRKIKKKRRIITKKRRNGEK